ncbi:hypothetical protein [Actinomycetospora sp. CA-084318]|uniref:hypothetical protein n=1 Tax=Actinomycetospora sp. CA-084318 TaxID=3239892 RepID=UPI003D9753DD
MLKRIWVLVLTIAATFSAPSSASGEAIPPCINYVHREEAGRVEIDLRPDDSLGTFSVLTMWWFINDIEARPGIYTWNHLVNGRATSSPNMIVKDDNLHTALRMIDQVRGPQWSWGDVYTLQATHYSPATNTTYVAAYNRCRITPR